MFIVFSFATLHIKLTLLLWHNLLLRSVELNLIEVPTLKICLGNYPGNLSLLQIESVVDQEGKALANWCIFVQLLDKRRDYAKES
jgi:hypothetical protein